MLFSMRLYRVYDQAMKKKIGVFVTLSAFVFISNEIEHVWSWLMSIDVDPSNGERYTYAIGKFDVQFVPQKIYCLSA